MNGNIKRPNVLLLHVDQHRFDCLGAYGNEDIKTPNLDKLAEDGVLYKNSFCSYPVCTPSRYSLLSGLYVHQHQGWNNACTLSPGLDTFPRILREAGYKTKSIGKMHFTPRYLDVGFEKMELAESIGKGILCEYTTYLHEEGLGDVKAPPEFENFGAVKATVDEEHHVTTWIANRALDTIEKWEDGSNLLMLGFNRPHRPFDPPAPWDKMYDPEQLTLLPGWTENCLNRDLERTKNHFSGLDITEEKAKEVMAHYYACISQIDYQIGRIVDLLKKKELYDSTLIIYTSDHGEYMGFHHLMGKGNYMYDPIMRTPLIIKYPGQIRNGEISETLVNNIDIAPTILKSAGCEPGRFMKGIDLSQNEASSTGIVFAERAIATEYMVRSSTRKLILCNQREKSLFFDLTNDPMEMNNLYNNPNYQNEIQEYSNMLYQWILFEAPSPINLDKNAPTV